MSLAIDTNLLVYVQDDRDVVKQRIATELYRELAARDDVGIGLQVMGELYSVLTRKLKQDPVTARTAIESLTDVFEPFAYDTSDVHEALAAASDGLLSYWDALLLSAARRAGHTVLISEDMQDGYRYAGITVVSPFAGKGSNPRLQTLLGVA